MIDHSDSARSSANQASRIRQAETVLKTIRDDAETLAEAKILAQTVVGKKEEPK